MSQYDHLLEKTETLIDALRRRDEDLFYATWDSLSDDDRRQVAIGMAQMIVLHRAGLARPMPGRG